MVLSKHNRDIMYIYTVRLVPVQITIPAQQGNPQSQPRALTVQVKTNRVRVRATRLTNIYAKVPAHALQQGGSSGSTLQQVLTQAITQVIRQSQHKNGQIMHSSQALSYPAEHAAMFLQTQINSAFRL